ncbi:MAG: glycerol-3-phosphate 1-O-acyltransferase [Actinomycetota bacterium]|nr:glycerol-3-phosphate 1-O-acyltransferase [Actinomycetota bacterium]
MTSNPYAAVALRNEPQWPDEPGPYLVLLESSGPLERKLLTGWIERNKPGNANAGTVQMALLPQTRRRRRRRRLDPRIEAFFHTGEDPLLIPLRISWLPSKKGGKRTVGWRDLLTLGDPRDPDPVRQYVTWQMKPNRCRIVIGEPTRASAVRKAWEDPTSRGRAEGTGLAEFAALRAWIRLERAERQLRGSKYKVPKFPRESLIEHPTFTAGVAKLAQESDTSYQAMAFRTRRYAKEIAATHSPYVIDLVTGAIRWLISKAYTELDYDNDELSALYAMSQNHPLVFLPSHKSNFDHLVLQYVLHQNELPPNHTAGGINMNFFPIGPILRRSGVFFIRREFRDNEPYKFVLRRYVDYLLEKRFPMEWYIEGGRSRSGKLRAPRFGMLAYVIDSYARGSAEDIVIIPVSIAYDQIQDVGAYASEQAGGAKESESLGWLVNTIRGLRRRSGAIHLRFGAPISLKGFVALQDDLPDDPDDTRNPVIPKLAFEVAVRLNEVTPITPTSLVTLALLSADDRSLSVAETVAVLEPYLDFVTRRDLPTSEKLTLDQPANVAATLAALDAHGVVESFAGATATVYRVRQNQHLAAAYYRNTIIHFFVNRAITELALIHTGANPDGDVMASVLKEALRLRDLLKFEFFFSSTDEFEREIRNELADHDDDLTDHLNANDVEAILMSFRPFVSHAILRPFFEAYRVVGDIIEEQAYKSGVNEDTVRPLALTLGKQYVLQGLVAKPESVSKVLFDSALSLATNRGLFQEGPDIVVDRQAFAAELRDAVNHVEALTALQAAEAAGLGFGD